MARVVVIALIAATVAFAQQNDLVLTPKALEVIENARDLARTRKHGALETHHVAAALFSDPNTFASKVLKKSGGDAALANAELKTALRKLKRAPSGAASDAEAMPNSRAMDNALRRIFAERRVHGDGSPEGGKGTVAHLLCVLLDDAPLKGAVAKAGSTAEGVRATARAAAGESYASRHDEAAETFDALSQYAIELVEKAAHGKVDPVVGRDDEIRRAITVLARRKKNNPVLTGPPGVGKTAIVEGLAQRVLEGAVPERLRKAKIWALDLGLLMAGAGARGAFEARLKAVVGELEADPHSVLFIDEIHMLIGAGAAGGAMDAANLLKPALARGDLRCIGATTDAEYARHVEKDPAFERRLQRVAVPEPSVDATVAILRGLRGRYEAHHGVRVLDGALLAAARLSDRYVAGKYNPDKAIDLLDEACARRRVELDSRPASVDALERRVGELAGEREALERERALKTSGILERFFSTNGSPDEAAADRKMADLGRLEKNAVRRRDAAAADWARERAHYDDLRRINLEIEDVEKDVATYSRNRRHRDAADGRSALAALRERRSGAVARAAATAANSTTGVATDVVGAADIADVVSQTTGIPAAKLTADESAKLLELGERLSRRVVGQAAATRAVADTVLRSRAGLRGGRRPRGAFLFLGPTGVGKTETAKALAEELFDDANALVRLDMSEYAEKHSVSRLVGAPPGYVGHDDGGQLTEACRRRPYSVILLDEADKAHDDVFDAFLQVLDDGRLTDSKGRTVDFSHAYVILTANLDPSDLSRRFRPEFLNRLDEVVVFGALDRPALEAIAKSAVQALSDAASEEHGATVAATDAAAAFIVEANADEIATFGARPLRRYVDREIATDLARLALSGALPESKSLVLDARDGALVLEGDASAASPGGGGRRREL